MEVFVVTFVCLLITCITYSSRSLFHHSFHEFPCHLWGVRGQHQQGMLWEVYPPTQLAKWRQVLLHAYNSYYDLISLTLLTHMTCLR